MSSKKKVAATSASPMTYNKHKTDSPSSNSSSSTPSSNSSSTVYKRWTVPMTNELARLLLKYKEHRIDSSNSFTNTGFREIQAELKQSFTDQYEINKFEIKKMREKLKQINNEILGFKKFLSSEPDVRWCISEGKLYLKDISKIDTLKKNASSSNYPGLSWNSIRRYLVGGCHYIYLHSTQFFIDNKKSDSDNSNSLIDLFDNPDLNKAFNAAPLDQILASIHESVQNDDFNVDNDDIVSENIGIYNTDPSSPRLSGSTFSSDTKSINGSSTKVKRSKHHHSPSSSPTSKRQKKQIDDSINRNDNESPVQPHQYYPNYYINNNSNTQFDTFYSSTNVKKPSAPLQNLVHNNSNPSSQSSNILPSSQNHSSGQQQNTERNTLPPTVTKKSSFSMLAAVLNKPLASNSGTVSASNILSNTSNSRSSSTSSTASSSGSINGTQSNRIGSSAAAVRSGTPANPSSNISLNGASGSSAAAPAGPLTTNGSTVPGSVNMNVVSPFNPGNIPNLYDPFSTRLQRGSSNSQLSNVQAQNQQQSSSSANSLLQQRNSSATTSSRRSLTFLDSLWNFHGSGSGSASGGTGMGSNGSFFLPNPNLLYTGSPNLAINNGSFSGVGGSSITSNPLNIASPPLNPTFADINGSTNKDSIISNSESSSLETQRNSASSTTQQHDASAHTISSSIPANANNRNDSMSGASSRRSNSNPDLFLLPDPAPSSTTSSPRNHNHHISSVSSSTNNRHVSTKPAPTPGRPIAAVITASAIDSKRASSPSILPPLVSMSSKSSLKSNGNDAKIETFDVGTLDKANTQRSSINSHSDQTKYVNSTTAEDTSPSSHNSSLTSRSTNEASSTAAMSNSHSETNGNGNMTNKITSSYSVNIHNEHDDVTAAASTLNDISTASRTPSFTGSASERPDNMNTNKGLTTSSSNNSNVPIAIAHSLGNSSGPINTFNGVPLEFISPFSSNVANIHSKNLTNETTDAIATSHHSNSRNHHNGLMELPSSNSKTPVSPTAAHKAYDTSGQTGVNNVEMNSLMEVLFNRRKNIEEANDYLRKLRSLGIINSKVFIELGEIISTNDSLLFYIINKEIVFEEKVNFIKDLVLNQ